MRWKTAYRSIQHAQAPEPEDLYLGPAETALLCIDVQNLYLDPGRLSRGGTPVPLASAHARDRGDQDHRQRPDRDQPASILANLGIRNVVLTGIFTDQCVSSTVRSLADESFFGSLARDTTRHT